MSCETEVSRAILRGYHEELAAQLQSDVVVVGAGPAGLVCAWRAAQAGLRVTILEKRLTPGGGVWGGAMGMGKIVVEKEVEPLLDALCVRSRAAEPDLLVADAAELASALVLKALQAGAVLLNLIYLEDLVVRERRVRGVVGNRAFRGARLPLDPLAVDARWGVDATGHEAAAAKMLDRRGLLGSTGERGIGEGPMDARAAEEFVVQRTGPCFPGLYLAGMSVCAVFGGPRMGPIFGGMLRSGERVAERILEDLREQP